MLKAEPKKLEKAKVEEVYPSTITFKCPKRGLVTQKVMIKKYTGQRPSTYESAPESEVAELLKFYEEIREDTNSEED